MDKTQVLKFVEQKHLDSKQRTANIVLAIVGLTVVNSTSVIL